MEQGVEISWLETTHIEHLIDHKFGLLDGAIVLSGNYNWGAKNAPKEEHFTITEGVPTLAQGFAEEFNFLTVAAQLPQAATRSVTALTGLLEKFDILKVLLQIEDT